MLKKGMLKGRGRIEGNGGVDGKGDTGSGELHPCVWVICHCPALASCGHPVALACAVVMLLLHDVVVACCHCCALLCAVGMLLLHVLVVLLFYGLLVLNLCCRLVVSEVGWNASRMRLTKQDDKRQPMSLFVIWFHVTNGDVAPGFPM